MANSKKTALFVLPPLILGLEILIGQAPVSAWLASLLDIKTSAVTLWGGGPLFGAFLVHHYTQVVRPFTKYENLESVKKNILDAHARPILDRYTRKGFSVRINVMVGRRALISTSRREKSDLWKGWSFWTYRLEPFWRSETMHHDGDAGLMLEEGQGVAGSAYQTGEPKYADLTVVPTSDYGLNPDQLAKTSDIVFVCSFPVRKFDFDAQRITTEVIGVVNIDSKDANSQVLVNDPYERAKLTKASEVFLNSVLNYFRFMSDREEHPYRSVPVPGHPGMYTIKGTKKPGEKVRSLAEIHDFLFGLMDEEKDNSAEPSDPESRSDA